MLHYPFIRGQSGHLGYFLGLLVVLVSDLLMVIFMVTFDLPHLWHDNFTWISDHSLH